MNTLEREPVAAPASVTPREKRFEVLTINRITLTRAVLTDSPHFAGFIFGEYRDDGTPVALYDKGELLAAANTITNTLETYTITLTTEIRVFGKKFPNADQLMDTVSSQLIKRSPLAKEKVTIDFNCTGERGGNYIYDTTYTFDIQVEAGSSMEIDSKIKEKVNELLRGSDLEKQPYTLNQVRPGEQSIVSDPPAPPVASETNRLVAQAKQRVTAFSSLVNSWTYHIAIEHRLAIETFTDGIWKDLNAILTPATPKRRKH